MKKLLIMALAAFAFAACSDDNDESLDPSSAGNNSGAKYMAINIVTNSSDTRATADETTDGTDGTSATTTDNPVFSSGSEDGQEYAVDKNSILFYFFDADGNSFYVSTVDGKDVNYKAPTKIESSTDASETTNVTQTHTVVAIEPKNLGTLPSQVVVILNYSGIFTPKNYTLNGLREEVIKSGVSSVESTADDNTTTTTNYLLMSNSVYYDEQGKAIVYATPISSDNLKNTTEAAAQNPVSIYVERAAAKVTTDYKTDKSDADGKPLFPFLKKDKDGNNVTTIDVFDGTSNTTMTAYSNLYVRINGYNLINNAKKSTLEKDVTGYANFPTGWNDAKNYRSYWATTQQTDVENIKYKYSEAGTDVAAIYYPLENTQSGTGVKNTGLIFAAEILQKSTDENGKDIYTPVPLVRMLTQYYTPAQAKKAIASYLNGKLYTTPYSETSVQTALTADNFEFVPTTSDDYYSTIQLKNQNETDKKYAINCYAKGSSDTLTTDTIQEILAKLPKIMYWNEGKCYYYETINHLPSLINQPGVVRNHWYELSVTGILGLGTPVPGVDDPVTPTRPTEEEWYLSTTINMLAWRKDAQDITLVSSNQ
jgi:hypothetical protein